MMIMGSCCRRNWYPVCVNFWVMIFNLSYFSSFSQPIINNIDPYNSLDDYLYNYSSSQILPKAYTGVLYDIDLPSNFSGMEVSILRLRGNTLWDEGANFSSIYVPPKVLPTPYVRRVHIMHENFGNWSSHYYKLPGYSFVTAIVGLAMYDASNLARTSPKRLDIQILDGPIIVHFPEVRVSEGLNVTRDLSCVMFHPTNGNVELSNMTSPNVCLWQALGHFGIAKPITSITPTPSPESYPRDPTSPSPYRRRRGSLHRKKRKNNEWKWWVIGFTGGLVGLGLLIVGTVVCYTMCTSRKIREMERRGEKSEALDTIWIGNSRMPLASMTRTQVTTLEDDSNP